MTMIAKDFPRYTVIYLRRKRAFRIMVLTAVIGGY